MKLFYFCTLSYFFLLQLKHLARHTEAHCEDYMAKFLFPIFIFMLLRVCCTCTYIHTFFCSFFCFFTSFLLLHTLVRHIGELYRAERDINIQETFPVLIGILYVFFILTLAEEEDWGERKITESQEYACCDGDKVSGNENGQKIVESEIV